MADAISKPHESTHVGVIGGGLAGSTIAMRLAGLGIKVTLLEARDSLVSGMPFCHLHAGGSMYPELSEEECLVFLRESVEFVKAFPQVVNPRPTVIAIPRSNSTGPERLIKRLELLKAEYARLVSESPDNAVLGRVEDYFRVYDEKTLSKLAAQRQPDRLASLDDWMVPVAGALDLSTCKLPLMMVQEHGLSAFRLSSLANMALQAAPNCSVLTNCTVEDVCQWTRAQGWQVSYLRKKGQKNTWLQKTIGVDYLVNACGYQSGIIDDMQGFTRERSVEFKSAYLLRWGTHPNHWPEVVFHGDRGTPAGMVQLTPFAGDYFLVHGMTPDITLFQGGLSFTSNGSSQPEIDGFLQEKLDGKWRNTEIEQRSRNAIDQLARFIPTFANARPVGRPMFGAQQIPGDDPLVRVASTSFEGEHYARSEIVKANSVLRSANAIVDALGLTYQGPECTSTGIPADDGVYPLVKSIQLDEVTRAAERAASKLNYPPELAKPYGSPLPIATVGQVS